MKTKYFAWVFLVVSILYFTFSGFGSEPDLVLLYTDSYKFGINYSSNAGLKLLSLLLIIIFGVIASSASKEEKANS